MHWTIRLLPGGQVATGVAAIGRRDCQSVVVIDVADGAGHVGMSVGQQESRGAVIEGDIGPCGSVVALRAVCRRESRTCLRVRRVICLLPSRQVAAGVAAIGWRDLEIVIIVDMAGGASQISVPVGQQEPRGAVIEFGTQPAVKIVATLTIARSKRRTCARVWWVRRRLPILQMAGITAGGKPNENPCGSLFVALVTLHRGMLPKEWKPVLVILYLLHGDIPTVHGVTLLAIGAHLAAVNIRMTVRAILAHIRKYWLHVALHTLHLFMHSAKRIIRLVVVKFWDRANGAPTSSRVTVLTGYR
jgi:hypothetical protein